MSEERNRQKEYNAYMKNRRERKLKCYSCGDRGTVFAVPKARPDHMYAFSCGGAGCNAAFIQGLTYPQWEQHRENEFFPLYEGNFLKCKKRIEKEIKNINDSSGSERVEAS